MKQRLTASLISRLEPKDRAYMVWDTQLSGFGLQVLPSGTKTFKIRKPDFYGPRKSLQITLGKLGDPLTLDVARKRARQARLLMDEGIDPRDQKLPTKMTISSFIDQFSEETEARKKPGTIALEEGLIKRHIKPILGAKKVETITPSDIRNFMKRVATQKEPIIEKTKARGKAVVTGGVTVANRARRVLSSMFTHAIELGLRTDNPCLPVRPLKEQSRERFLTEEEFGSLGDALDEAEAAGVNIYAIAAIRIIALTGARKNEILSLKWSYLDRARLFARLPDSKTGAKVLAIPSEAWIILDELPRKSESDFVFPSLKTNGHLIGLQKIWNEIRANAGLSDVRLHDLRHSFASVGVMQGQSLFLVGKLLGHARSSTTERYAHLRNDPLRNAGAEISRTIGQHLKVKG